MKAVLAVAAAASFALAPADAVQAPVQSEVEAPGPSGPLRGTMLAPASSPRAVMLIIPGSGPADRNGNSPLGVTASPYRLLAEGLVARGVATVRIDKRGMFGSGTAIPDANRVTIPDYASDVHAWTRVVRERTGLPCVWVAGHSEGGLVALAAAQQPEGLCGIVLISASGRPVGTVLREQLRANPANAPLLPEAMAALDGLEAGRRVSTDGMHPALAPLFASQVQDYLISLFSYDPAQLAQTVRLPMLIIQGQRDLQVGEVDARRLAAANPSARLVFVAEANHVLKAVPDDRNANIAAYTNPALPLAPGIVDAIADFVTSQASAGAR